MSSMETLQRMFAGAAGALGHPPPDSPTLDSSEQSFEALNRRSVAVVVDPIQSVEGKAVIDACHLINPKTMMHGQELRQTTSNLSHLNQPSIQGLINGLNRHYYSIAINYRKYELEEKMLLNLHKKKWTDGPTLQQFDANSKMNEQTVQNSKTMNWSRLEEIQMVKIAHLTEFKDHELVKTRRNSDGENCSYIPLTSGT